MRTVPCTFQIWLPPNPLSLPLCLCVRAQSAMASFQRLSSITGGKCEFLDINSGNGSESLVGLVCTSILAAIDSGGRDLVAEYNNKYTPVMTFAS